MEKCSKCGTLNGDGKKMNVESIEIIIDVNTQISNKKANQMMDFIQEQLNKSEFKNDFLDISLDY